MKLRRFKKTSQEKEDRDTKILANSAMPCSNTHEIAFKEKNFLDLPGEIRNLIYNEILFKPLRAITIANQEKKHHLGAGILHSPIFRVSRQIRAEALSFLCANKVLQFKGVVSANTFFSAIGPAIGDVKSIRLRQDVGAWEDLERLAEVRRCKKGGGKGESPATQFFSWVSRAETLKCFVWEGIGRGTGIEVGRGAAIEAGLGPGSDCLGEFEPRVADLMTELRKVKVILIYK